MPTQFVAGTKKRDHPAMTESAWRLTFAAILLTALAGCGPSSNPTAPQAGANAPANAPVVLTQPATVLVLPPAPNPDDDARPDRAKSDDFTGRLDRVQSDLARVDADFLRRIRATLQSDTPADAKLTLADYRSQIAADIAALPDTERDCRGATGRHAFGSARQG
jgi:hypothetical protein